MDNNYPISADIKDASWNDKRLPEEEFQVTISQTLSKNVKVNTNDYIPGEVYTEREWDGESYCTVTHQDSPNTSETNWKDAYKLEHDTPIHLINLFKRILENRMNIENMREERRQYLIEECSNWIEDDFEVCKD